MFRSKLKNISRSIPFFILMAFILVSVQINAPVQATVSEETSFSAEVILNKPGVTYDLSRLDNYAKEGTVKIVEDNDTGSSEKISKYYVYRSHSQQKLIVSLFNEHSTAYYPSEDSIDEFKIEGLGIKLNIPTESNYKQTDYETVSLKMDSKVHISEDFFEYMYELGFEKGTFELDEDKEGFVSIEYFRNEIFISLSNIDYGKSKNGTTEPGNFSIFVKAPAGSLNEETDNEIRDILQFLSIDPDELIMSTKQSTKETEKDYTPVVDIDHVMFDWNSAMLEEMEWLISQKIISGLTKDDIEDISRELKNGDLIFYGNGTWISFSDSNAISSEEQRTVSLSQLIDWRELSNDPPGHIGSSDEKLPHYLSIVLGLVMSLTLLSIIFSLYSRVRRRSILENINRKRIYEKIKAEPGVHFSALMERFNLSSGSLSHHINLLENEEYIKSRQDGMFRRFYLYEEKARLIFNLSIVQERILKVIMDNPGISQSGISNMIDSNKMRVNYHVKILRDADLLNLEKKGRESLCFITNAGREFMHDTF